MVVRKCITILYNKYYKELKEQIKNKLICMFYMYSK